DWPTHDDPPRKQVAGRGRDSCASRVSLLRLPSAPQGSATDAELTGCLRESAAHSCEGLADRLALAFGQCTGAAPRDEDYFAQHACSRREENRPSTSRQKLQPRVLIRRAHTVVALEQRRPG